MIGQKLVRAVDSKPRARRRLGVGCPEEAASDPAKFGLWDAHATIANLDYDRSVFLPCADVDRLIPWRVFEGIVDQVDDNSRQHVGVRVKRNRFIGHDEAQAFAASRHFEMQLHVSDDGLDLHRLRLKAAFAIIRHEPVDKGKQPIKRLADPGGSFSCRVRRSIADQADHIDGVANNRERRTKFMADDAHEVSLLFAQRAFPVETRVQSVFQLSSFFDCLPSGPLRQIEGLSEGRISSSS